MILYHVYRSFVKFKLQASENYVALYFVVCGCLHVRILILLFVTLVRERGKCGEILERDGDQVRASAGGGRWNLSGTVVLP